MLLTWIIIKKVEVKKCFLEKQKRDECNECIRLL